MPEASHHPGARWGAPPTLIELNARGVTRAGGQPLGALLRGPDAAAGVADQLLSLAQDHALVEDARWLRLDGGEPAWHLLQLARTPQGFLLTARPAGPARGSAAALDALRGNTEVLRSAIRHDVYAPLAMVHDALEIVSEDHGLLREDNRELLASAQATVGRVAARAHGLGHEGRPAAAPAPASAPPPAHVALWPLAEHALTATRPLMERFGVTVTRAVLPSVPGPAEAWAAAFVTTLRGAIPTATRGGHIHLGLQWAEGRASAVVTRVRVGARWQNPPAEAPAR